MPQYVTVTGDSRFEGLTDAHLIPGLHGVGLHDGRKVSIVAHRTAIHAVPSDQVEVWSTYTGHPDSGLQYQSSDKGGYRIVRVNRDTDTLTVLSAITGASEGDPAETELYARYTTRVNIAIEALEA
jgi:hypothetical protein